ncbi:MAG: FAD-dependent oxidoreductase [candidate division Zixibacteria bacterium]|nr:FAD-dependent oxidoreductase [candidate division Zixibacteria bacterium]
MAMKKVKKKKKKLGSLRTVGSGGSQTSPYKPKHVPKEPPCIHNCPSSIDIREFITAIGLAEKCEVPYEEAYKRSWEIYTDKSPIPACTGRVCPHPCQTECNRIQKEGEPVGINSLERFVGDTGLEKGYKLVKLTEDKHPEKIAVIGSGPAGISCAYQLARRGYSVAIYESFPKPGGMLRYGIPAYRLPRDIIDAEVKRLETDLDIEIKYNTHIGKDIPYEELRNQYDVIFVAIGAHKGRLLRVEGEDADNVYTGTGFLHAANSGEKLDIGDKVIVIGGGDTAIDAARVSKRLGAEATILYRRTREEMPAIDEEIEGALEEGIDIHYLAAPIKLEKDGNRATKMICLKMELGEPDDSGRRRPVPIEGSEFEVPCTAVVAAISQEPDFDGLENLREGRDWIKVNDQFETKEDKVFAGGDNLDLALVTDAVGHGRLAAEAIHRKLRDIPYVPPEQLPLIKTDRMVLSFYDTIDRSHPTDLPVEERWSDNGSIEIRKTLAPEEANKEAKRCMSCGACFDCGTCWSYCQDSAIEKPMTPMGEYKFKLDFCKGCKKCAEQCPCGYIEMYDPMTGQIVPLEEIKID